MENLNQKQVKKEENDLRKEEIVPGEDVLTNEMEEEVEGGNNFCISGKISAEDMKKSNELR